MVWPDYTLETTENKELNGTGGITGLTLKDAALACWFISRPVTARYYHVFHQEICCPNE